MDLSPIPEDMYIFTDQTHLRQQVETDQIHLQETNVEVIPSDSSTSSYGELLHDVVSYVDLLGKFFEHYTFYERIRIDICVLDHGLFWARRV